MLSPVGLIVIIATRNATAFAAHLGYVTLELIKAPALLAAGVLLLAG